MRHGNINMEGNIDMNQNGVFESHNLIAKAIAKTVNFDSGMNSAAIQALIDVEDKFVPAGTTLTFQYADGMYAVSAGIFSDFHGGGTVAIQGNDGESGLHTNQAVILNTVNDGITLRGTTCLVYIKNIRINLDLSVSTFVGVRANQCAGVVVSGCYANGDSDARGVGFSFNNCCRLYVIYCYITQTFTAISFNHGFGLSYNNDDTGTQPKRGLKSEASTLMKYGTQPTGSIANEVSSSGGIIR